MTIPSTRHLRFVEKPMMPKSSWRGYESIIIVVRESLEKTCFNGVSVSALYFSMAVMEVRWRCFRWCMLRIKVVKCLSLDPSSGRFRHSLQSVSLFLSSNEATYWKGKLEQCL